MKKFGRCYENTDKGQELPEVYIFVIKWEDQIGSNAETGVARVGSEPADTTNDKIGLVEKITKSKNIVFAVASCFWKDIYWICTINTTPTFE